MSFLINADGIEPALWHGLSPNHGGPLDRLKFLMMHYTAAWWAEGARDYLMNPEAPFTPSAHFVVGRDGQIWQIVPTRVKAWHAGRSYYQGVRGLNHHAIGIEIDNIGWLKPDGHGGFRDPYGRRLVVADDMVHRPSWRAQGRAMGGDPYCPVDDLVFARHPNGGPELAWPAYTEAQLQAEEDLTRAILARHPDIQEIIGHEDCRRDKTDPGPAFPMARFAGLLNDRQADAPQTWLTTVTLNVRGGPGLDFGRLTWSPLPPHKPVKVLDARGDWRFVNTNMANDDDPESQGWVHGYYLRRA